MLKMAKDFNQPLTSFDTSSVTDINYMFYSAGAFDQPLSFDTGSVKNYGSMFKHARREARDPNPISAPPHNTIFFLL